MKKEKSLWQDFSSSSLCKFNLLNIADVQNVLKKERHIEANLRIKRKMLNIKHKNYVTISKVLFTSYFKKFTFTKLLLPKNVKGDKAKLMGVNMSILSIQTSRSTLPYDNVSSLKISGHPVFVFMCKT